MAQIQPANAQRQKEKLFVPMVASNGQFAGPVTLERNGW
jgi:hypothetical protein